jgi:16S rRNA (guanine966-N2)-methyltransferase
MGRSALKIHEAPVMRVVAGKSGGIPLKVPKTELRPTMDMVKSAIFSSLGDQVVGARVLDLFAGSGALGIEALSRGAAWASFVEKDRRAAQVIEENLEKTRLAGEPHEVRVSDAFSFLDRRGSPQGYNVIFADPPYAGGSGERDFTPELLASAGLRNALAAGGVFVLEFRPGERLPLGNAWECVKQKRYGGTEVAWLRVREAE